MSVNEANLFKLEVLRQRIIDLETENCNIKAKKAELETKDAELKARIEELEKNKGVTTKLESENAELKARVVKLEKDYRQIQNSNIIK
ncbi:3140_t:CDS:1, partial [Cetraspora pellucida]